MIATELRSRASNPSIMAGAKGVLEGHAQGMADAGAVPVVLVPQAELQRK
jgi:hypothetical protein